MYDSERLLFLNFIIGLSGFDMAEYKDSISLGLICSFN